MAVKPTIEEVIKYATPLIHKFIGASASDLPREQKEEITQQAMLRLWKAYADLNADDGWKSFVYNHCRGAVLDYLKFGNGFQESKWSLHHDAKKKTPKLSKRVQPSDTDDESPELQLDRIAGAHGIFSELDPDKIEIKWHLLARMASQDEHLHAFAKYLRGLSVEEMAPVFGLCRTRVSQMVQAFIDRFDDPEHSDCVWFKQCCYALGISKQLGMTDEPARYPNGNFVGFNLKPVDLDSVTPHHYLLELDAQQEMKLDEEEEA